MLHPLGNESFWVSNRSICKQKAIFLPESLGAIAVYWPNQTAAITMNKDLRLSCSCLAVYYQDIYRKKLLCLKWLPSSTGAHDHSVLFTELSMDIKKELQNEYTNAFQRTDLESCFFFYLFFFFIKMPSGCIISMHSVLTARRDSNTEGFYWLLMDSDLGNVKKVKAQTTLGSFGALSARGLPVWRLEGCICRSLFTREHSALKNSFLKR